MNDNKDEGRDSGFTLGVYDDEQNAAPASFKEWVANFFYHYKWHTIIALFLVFAIIVCSVQMCRRTEYDVYVLYAGGTDIDMTVSQSTGQSEYLLLCDAIAKYSKDFDENGSKTVNLQNLFLPSEKEIAEIEADKEREVNYRLIAEHNESFKNNIYTGEYYVCFIAEHLYREWAEKESVPFARIGQYLPEGADVELAGEHGVYLRSTELYSEAGFSMLGEDTVICIRLYSDVSLLFGDKENREVYANSEELLRSLLAGE